jgi:hypothetical protein
MDHGPTADQRQGLQQGGDRLVAALEAQLGEVGGAQIRFRSASWKTIASPSAESWTSSSMP